MKRIILLATLLVTVSFSSFSQEFEGKGDVYLNVGIGLLDNQGKGYDYHGISKVELPAFNLSLDFGIHKWITVGPYFGLQTRSFKSDYYDRWDGSPSRHIKGTDLRIRETWLNFGGRGLFMVTPFLNEVANTNLPENLHLYAGILLGLEYYHKNVRYNDRGEVSYSHNNVAGSAALLAAGARYMFSPGFGAYLELYPIGHSSVINTGLSFKF